MTRRYASPDEEDLMPAMVATVPRTVTVHARRYAADAGQTVEAHPADVARLAGFGFEPAPDAESDVLEDATLGELRELAKAANLRGRTTMTREELLEALRTVTGQEA